MTPTQITRMTDIAGRGRERQDVDLEFATASRPTSSARSAAEARVGRRAEMPSLRVAMRPIRSSLERATIKLAGGLDRAGQR